MESFVAIDFETANSNRESACAIGVVKVVNGQIEEEFESLLRPSEKFNYFDPFNTEIHGISQRDVKDAPLLQEIWPDLVEIIDGLPIVAHNAGFDVSVLARTLGFQGVEVDGLDFYCSLVLSRRALDLVTYKLPFVAAELGVPVFDHHDALSDARAAAQITLALLARAGFESLDEAATALNVVKGQISGNVYRGSQYKGSTWHSLTKSELDALAKAAGESNLDEKHPLFGRQVVFTGTLASMKREDAQMAVISLGGFASPTVNAKTDFLVVGLQDSRMLKPGATNSSKFEKAQVLHAKGSPIEVIDEMTFLTLLDTND